MLTTIVEEIIIPITQLPLPWKEQILCTLAKNHDCSKLLLIKFLMLYTDLSL